jgi:hypothetical protein
MFYLFGVDHFGAQTYLDGKGPGHIQLECSLSNQFDLSQPAVVAEEMNCEWLNGRKSVPLEFANSHRVEHAFCEPNIGWRLANHCLVVDDIQRQLGFRTEPFVKNNLRLAAEAIDVAINYPKRERYWLERLAPFHHLDVFFVCGYDHLESFKRLLADNCVPYSPIDFEIGVVPQDKADRLKVRNFLKEHPSLRSVLLDSIS